MTADLPIRTGHQLPPIHRMPRVFLPNFDFEHQLAEPSRTDFGEPVRQINADLASVWLAIAEPGDAVWSPTGLPLFVEDDSWAGCSVAPSSVRWVHDSTGWLWSSAASPQLVADSPSLGRGDELCPWGWSEQAVTWGQQRGLNCTAPPIEVVREVNSRRFSFELEMSLNVGLPEARFITSLEQFSKLFEKPVTSVAPSDKLTRGWIIKGLFGMAGRERIAVDSKRAKWKLPNELEPLLKQLASRQRGPLQISKDEWFIAKEKKHRYDGLSAGMMKWVIDHLNRDGAVIFEPWLDRIAEASLQWDIPQRGEPIFIGVAPMIDPPNSSGGYFGSRIDPFGRPLTPNPSPQRGEGRDERECLVNADAIWSDAIDVTSRVAYEVQRRGYFGPLGIDAMLYRDDAGQTRLRPIQDVNARFTMGRLALGWRRFLKPNEFGSWLHLNWNVRDSTTAREWIAAARDSLPEDVRLLWTFPVEIGGRVPRKQAVLVIAPNSTSRSAAEATLIQLVSRDS